MAGSRVLTVGVGPTFAIRWLIPRLADFQKQAPDVEVRFATGGATVPYNDDWTCGISARLRRLAGPARGAIVRGRPHFRFVRRRVARRLKAPERSGERRNAAAGRARVGRLAALAGGVGSIEDPDQRSGVRLLRAGACRAASRRRRGCDRGFGRMSTTTSRTGRLVRAVCAIGAARQAMVSDLARRRATNGAAFRGVPGLARARCVGCAPADDEASGEAVGRLAPVGFSARDAARSGVQNADGRC